MVLVKRPASPDYETEVDTADEVDIPTPNARQAVTHHNVRYVLAVSLGVAVLALIVAYFAFFAG
ncbi:MAG TPA: hypothetical protein VFK86_09725 [Bauldia sp.]|nr:hypothetical protein [Bauldia sp.]